MKPKTFNIIKWVFFPIFFIWCILQNMIGFSVWVYHKCIKEGKKEINKDGIVYFTTTRFGGVSLGYFIFLKSPSDTDCHHEFGHQIQSLLLGPLYLFIIGLPSAIVCGCKLYSNNYEYYNFPWESWADNWGSIEHKNLKYDRSIKKN